MRTYSTPDSALQQQITKLAIFECIVSIGLYVGIGMYLGTFRYLATAVIFAPLMLFRTDASAEWGLKVYRRVNDSLNGNKILAWLPTLIELAIEALLVAVAGTVIRIVATLYWAVRRPLHTLSEAPQNWVRQALCTDFAHPPEVVPLEAAKGDDSTLRFKEFAEMFREENELIFRMVLVLVFFPFIIIGWLPSVIYRISFKATALAYAPFVWVAHSTLRSRLSLKSRLERITEGEFEKVRRGFSYFVLATLVGKLALILGVIDRAYLGSKFPSEKLFTSIVVLNGWPWWQITLAADAVLTFVLLFFADAALVRLKDQQQWPENLVLKTTQAGTFLRGALGLLTISHFFYLALHAVAPSLITRLLSI